MERHRPPRLVSIARRKRLIHRSQGRVASTAARRWTTLSQLALERRCSVMNATSETWDRSGIGQTPFDFEGTFRGQYERIARVIASVVRDRARAEELAVEVFLKLWRTPSAQGESAGGWLYRTAVRKGLDELRRRARLAKYERLLGFGRVMTPEDIHAANEGRERVRAVLAALPSRHSELLILRSQGLSYSELGSSLKVNPTSIGTLLVRAQQMFRKEYVKRYGQE
jgi:RNA polymerase sigma-70 factor (ECF subfamily)